MRATTISPFGPCHAGIAWPHQSWREMHHSWMFERKWLYVFVHSSGMIFGGHVLHRAEPLRRDHRLDHAAGALALREREHVRLRSTREALLVERLLHRGARALAVEARERSALLVEGAVEVEDVDLLEVVPLAGREVVEVVRRRDLHRAGAELGVDEDRVGDDRDLSIDERVNELLAVEVLVALVVGVHRDGRIAEHRLGTRGRDHEEFAGRAVDLVGELEEFAVGAFLVLDLEIGERRAALGAPVDEARRSVDEAGLVEAHERLGDRDGQVGVHRELGALPVGGGAEHALLLRDRAAALGLPLPDALDERLASEVVARLALTRELPLDDGLGRDAGVVDAGEVERVLSAHALPPREDVLERRHQGVPHVERARDVRGRHRDDVRRPRVVRVVGRVEDAFLLPERVPALLYLARVVRLLQVRLGIAHDALAYHTAPRSAFRGAADGDGSSAAARRSTTSPAREADARRRAGRARADGRWP